ncbi:MAG: hypothetical protein U9N00_03945 [Candidatus Bipolaricaulota bacterium]|nr:hypothetical protein [Candidatus Bipolaricaulota bacterium]
MNDIRGRTEDGKMIARLAVQREGLNREGSKRTQPALEAVHSLL